MHTQNDIPVFFIRDGIKFVDLVHSLKPSPRKHVQEGWRVLDFLSHHPESCNIVRGVPALHDHHTADLLGPDARCADVLLSIVDVPSVFDGDCC